MQDVHILTVMHISPALKSNGIWARILGLPLLKITLHGSREQVGCIEAINLQQLALWGIAYCSDLDTQQIIPS